MKIYSWSASRLIPTINDMITTQNFRRHKISMLPPELRKEIQQNLEGYTNNIPVQRAVLLRKGSSPPLPWISDESPWGIWWISEPAWPAISEVVTKHWSWWIDGRCNQVNAPSAEGRDYFDRWLRIRFTPNPRRALANWSAKAWKPPWNVPRGWYVL